jgi:hypothetical protein
MSASGVRLGLIVGTVALGIVWILSSYGLGITGEERDGALYKTSTAFAIIGFLVLLRAL